MSFCKRAVTLMCFVLLLMVGLTACIDGDVAKSTINGLFKAVEQGDFATAEEYLHPDRPADLEKFFAEIEKDKQVDFQSGVEILRYPGTKSSHYDIKVDGSAYSATAIIQIGNRSAEVEVVIVDNDLGYGIYGLDIDVEDKD